MYDIVAVDSSAFYWSEYRNIQDYNISGDDFTFSTTFYNSFFHKKHSNNESIIIIVGEKERIQVVFQNRSRSHFGTIIFAEKRLNGKNDDLSMFGLDVTQASNVRIENVNKNILIYFNDSLIYQTTYQKSIGNIKSLIFSFAGGGIVDAILL